MQINFLNIDIRRENNDLTLFKLKGEITSEIYTELVDFCKDKVEKNNTLFDFEEVKYISSGGMAALLVFKQIADKANKKFVIFGIKSGVKKIIELTKLENMFIIKENEEEAMRLLDSGKEK